MSNISRFTAALCSGTQETTLALASLNFDFTLVKLEPPAEFAGLGAALSHQRRMTAEKGTTHITARKLGALFEQCLPPTPNLFQAYGRRASKIAESPSVNPRASNEDGIFADRVGVDGTSIWAAATSGPGAIAVHLLACILARVWSGPEATSIWVEIVTERKRELSASFSDNEPLYYPTIAASQVALSREQLANWDASARAWLRAADRVMVVEQKQLMLIIDNIRIPVNNKMHVYESVLQAWKTTMVTVEKLISGMPQSVQNGEILLGLSAWHLYPDMLVLANTATEIKQKDELVAPGGSVTIGLESTSHKGSGGVYWCLPLAHLRYYGEPVSSRGSIGLNASRISLEQLLQVALGSVFGAWRIHGNNMVDAAELLAAIWGFFSQAAVTEQGLSSTIQEVLLTSNWIRMLTTAAKAFIESDGDDRQVFRKLIAIGQRRCATFLLQEQDYMPLFGLNRFSVFLKLLNEEEERITILRKFASKLDIKYDDIIIRYKATSLSLNSQSFEYASALPCDRSSAKRSYEGDQVLSRGHIRWLASDSIDDRRDQLDDRRDKLDDRRDKLEEKGEVCRPLDKEDIKTGPSNFYWHVGPHFMPTNRSAHRSNVLTGVLEHQAPSKKLVPPQRFDFLCGDANIAAVFVKTGKKSGANKEADLQEIKNALSKGAFNAERLLAHVSTLGDETDNEEDQLRSLKALASVANIYKLLPNASIAIKVSSRPLRKSRWIPKSSNVGSTDQHFQRLRQNIRSYDLDRTRAFACIAMFESGSLDIDPSSIANVMAMSTGDSIYVAAPLLCDPSEKPLNHEIRRIVGNVGRAGIAMMVPPVNSRIREPDLEKWHLIPHADFDGRIEDSFSSNSLHLTFTDYEMPIGIGASRHGARDFEAFILESLVSIHDRGKWVADLDVLAMSESNLIRVANCVHKSPDTDFPVSDRPFPLTSIDNWDEFLDRPSNAGIFRARRNWQARLAAASTSVQMGYPTVLLPDKLCWLCCFNNILTEDKSEVMLIC